jgi:glycosyltransferase involved in cell wall biosynthesis
VKIVFHLHGKGIAKASKYKFLKLLYKFTFKNQNIISLSELLTFDVEPVYNSTPFIINNGIPEVEIIKEGNNISSAESNFTVIFLSNLIESKGIFDYLEVLSHLSKHNPTIRGIIVGNEGNVSKEKLLSEISNMGLINFVRYVGPKYGDDIFYIL